MTTWPIMEPREDELVLAEWEDTADWLDREGETQEAIYAAQIAAGLRQPEEPAAPGLAAAA